MYDSREQIEAYKVPLEPRLCGVSRNRNCPWGILRSSVVMR